MRVSNKPQKFDYFQVKDKKVNANVISALAKGAITDKTQHDKIDAIATKCATIPTEERCLIGIKLWLCLQDEARKEGFDVDKLFSR